jgi:hypothetical protein
MHATYDFDSFHDSDAADRAPQSPLLGFLLGTGLAVLLWALIFYFGLTLLW